MSTTEGKARNLSLIYKDGLYFEQDGDRLAEGLIKFKETYTALAHEIPHISFFALLGGSSYIEDYDYDEVGNRIEYIECEGLFKNGKKEGHWVAKEEFGNLISEGNYNNGLKEGHWKTFSNHSYLLSSEGHYVNGIEEGEWKYFVNIGAKGGYDDVTEKYFLKNGRREGSYIITYRLPNELYATAQKFEILPGCYYSYVEVGNFKNNFKNGTSIIYKWDLDRFDNPNLVSDANSEILFSGQYFNGVKVDQTIEQEPRLNSPSVGQYENGVKEGYWVSKGKDGQVLSEGNYKNGKKDGHWVTKDEDGNFISLGSYKKGKKKGAWEHYFEPGLTRTKDRNYKLSAKGSYKKDKKVGYWVEWHEDMGNLDRFKSPTFFGLIRSEGDYIDDIRVGEWLHYDSNDKQIDPNSTSHALKKGFKGYFRQLRGLDKLD